MSSAARAFSPVVKSLARSALGQRLNTIRHILGARLAFKPGHFYSPICHPADLAAHYTDPAKTEGRVDLPGIDLNEAGQRALWQQWRSLLAEFPYQHPGQQPGLRYRTDNPAYGIGDATILYAMLRHFQPKRMIEVGSGFSSACALDTNERYLGNAVQMSFIEPYPDLLKSMLKPGDLERITIIPSKIQDVPLTTFDHLDAGDILFIDSTHIVKTGSDVVHELFHVLPRLKPGVVVHFHDVHYPFEYPAEWVVDRNYSWNEVYALRAFLMHNSAFEILFFNDAFCRLSRDLVHRDSPGMLANPGGGLWLRRKY
jgi:predicted O-methyltransferase YrrM